MSVGNGKPASLVYNADLKIASLKNSKKVQVVVKCNKVAVVATGTNGEKANMEITSSVKKIKVKK